MCFDISGGKTTALTLPRSKSKQAILMFSFFYLPSLFILCPVVTSLGLNMWCDHVEIFSGGREPASTRWASSAHSLGFYSRLCGPFHSRILEQLYLHRVRLYTHSPAFLLQPAWKPLFSDSFHLFFFDAHLIFLQVVLWVNDYSEKCPEMTSGHLDIKESGSLWCRLMVS